MPDDERRLAAIMFTDVVGFTSMGQENETEAMEVLETYRQLLRPLFTRHRGREVKTIGDGFLVEFGSALEATLCAIDVQNSVHGLNLERGRKLQVRVGIHLGDVIRQGDDILGDAVNVASRIEPLARPGGICITGQVQDHVKNKIPYSVVMLPERDLKNVKEKVNVYSVVLPWEEEKGESETDLDRRRVAVLPLVSMSPDPNDEFFADGVTEELISTMSNIAELQVISRTSVMHFKKTNKTMAEIAKELSAGSILEGSVRKAGGQIRVTVQLIDTNRDSHVWAKSYDRELKDVFAIQSDISMSIADALRVQLLAGERARVNKVATENPEAHLLYMKGRYAWNERTRDSLGRAITYFQRAIKEDSGFALAYSGMADTYSVLLDHGYVSLSEAGPLAMQYAEKAVELADDLSEPHASLGLALSSRERQRAVGELKRAIELNPNNAYAQMWYSLVAPDIEDALSFCDRAAKLDPLNLQIGSTLGATYYLAGRTAEAIGHLKKILELDPEFPPARIWLSLSYLQAGMKEDAVREVRDLNKRHRRPHMLAIILAGAGLREEASKLADEFEHSSVYSDPADLAWIYAMLGTRDKALAYLKKAVAGNTPHLTYFLQDPTTAEFRKDPLVDATIDEAGIKARN